MKIDNELRKYWLITLFCFLFSVIAFSVVIGVYYTQINDSSESIKNTNTTLNELILF